jgi:hypothetical protein
MFSGWGFEAFEHPYSLVHKCSLSRPITQALCIKTGLHLPSIASCLKSVEGRVRDYKERGFGKNNTESVPELFGSFFLKVHLGSCPACGLTVHAGVSRSLQQPRFHSDYPKLLAHRTFHRSICCIEDCN